MTLIEIKKLLSDIPSNYNDHTLEMLYQYIPTLPAGEFLEFGTGLGLATCVIAICNPDLRITTFDNAVPYNYPNYDAHIAKTLADHGVNGVEHFTADSLTYDTDKEFVGINLDSGHSYELTRDEISRWIPKLKKNGIIFFDDYRIERVGVKRAVDEYLQDHADEFEILDDGMCFVMRKL